MPVIDSLLKTVLGGDSSKQRFERLTIACAVPFLTTALWNYAKTVVEVTDSERKRWVQQWLLHQKSSLARARQFSLLPPSSMQSKLDATPRVRVCAPVQVPRFSRRTAQFRRRGLCIVTPSHRSRTATSARHTCPGAQCTVSSRARPGEDLLLRRRRSRLRKRRWRRFPRPTGRCRWGEPRAGWSRAS